MGILRFIGRLFLAIGILILLFYLVLFLTMTYQFTREPIVDFDDNDVQQVLTWLQQPGNPSQLLHSHHPPANWAGDFEKMFALQLDQEITQEVVGRTSVTRGDQLSEDLQQAISFAMFFTRDLDWFPAEAEVLTDAYYVSQFRIVLQSGYPDAVYLAIIHPEHHILYYVEAKM
ncbi:MAG: hypothetical protein CMQ20_16265 [Gammaproteobacteria bacterium]|jgi:hypothetical protein|nr:hypothetical protein [Gammaproteobacteria bacterium]|tara:strand:+ start:1020 stop:1538 length:519 start_codon:yes stop_codon:yes gene_type:complete